MLEVLATVSDVGSDTVAVVAEVVGTGSVVLVVASVGTGIYSII